MYLSYEEYNAMGGNLEETAFDSLLYEAEVDIDWVTFHRLKNETEYPEQVKKCCFELIKLLYSKRQALLGGAVDSNNNVYASISSQSNDGVSVSYNILSAQQLYEFNKLEISNIIKRYLFDVRNSKGHRLTYRGIYADE